MHDRSAFLAALAQSPQRVSDQLAKADKPVNPDVLAPASNPGTIERKSCTPSFDAG